MQTNDRHAVVDGVVCEQCGKEFSARKQRVEAGYGRFCSITCSNKFHAKGEGKKYVGKENGKTSFDKVKNAYYVYWFEPGTLKRKTTSFARWYWEVNKGEIPDGYRASYKDGNAMNISPDNIILISPEEFGSAISKRMDGVVFSDETKKKMSEAKRGKPLSNEHKIKIGNASRNLWASGKFDNIHKGEHNSHWRGGVEKVYPVEFNEELKSTIKNRDKYKCRICEKSLHENRDAQVHHINGNRTDNSLDNLILLCSECHHQVHKPNRKLELILAFHSKLFVDD